jgi:hypothetical protein
VTSDAGLMAPSRILKRTVPAYNVCKDVREDNTTNEIQELTGSWDTKAICLRYS